MSCLDNYPWKQRGICLFAPMSEEVDAFCRYVEEELAPDHIDTLLLIIRYNYMFESHPECRGEHPLSREDVKRMVDVCRRNGIELIPDMNLLGHQTVQDTKRADGLLAAHPEFSETPISEEPEYSYSICASNKEAFAMVCDLMDEVMDAFEAKFMHMGMDEVFYIGDCERCKASGKDNGELFAAWCNGLAAHIKARGVVPMMWGDRLLNSFEFLYGPWDASQNGTWTALPLIDKDIIITDWHYHNWDHFRSVEVFAEAGMKIWLCPSNDPEYAKLFFDYALEHGGDNILGVMQTTWVPVRYVAGCAEGREQYDDAAWYANNVPHIRRCYDWLFRS